MHQLNDIIREKHKKLSWIKVHIELNENGNINKIKIYEVQLKQCWGKFISLNAY